MAAIRALATALLVVLASLTLACGESAPDATTAAVAQGSWAPLLDPDHHPDLLLEERRLDPPPSLDGNRFLLGWSGFRRGGTQALWSEPALRPHGVARLELTTLEPRPRTLVLDVETRRRVGRAWQPVGEPVAIEVTVPGCDAAAELCRRQALLPPRGRLEVELPPLAVGRASVDLRLPDDVGLVVRQGGVRQALAAGTAEVADAVEPAQGEVRLAGWAGLDFVRRVTGPATLRGRFVPPADPGPGERHSLWIETAGEAPRRVFQWSADSFVDRWGGDRQIAVTLPGDGGRFVRVRLIAEGDGRGASWSDLGIASQRAAASTAAAAVPEVARPPRPRRIVLYVLDALRDDRFDATWMPGLRRLAQQGVDFTRHQSVAPNTRPSIYALLSGRTPMSPRGLGQLVERPLPAAIRDAGYRTVLFSDNGNVSPGWGMDRGFDQVVMGWAPEAVQPLAPHNNSAQRMQHAALAWLDRLPAEQSAFVYLHVLNPHNPYLPPRELLRREPPPSVDGSTTTLLQVQRGKRKLRRAERQGLRDLYDASVRYADRQLARFAKELAERHAPGEVLLVVTADHGEELFDHGGVLHGFTLYEEQLAVPLVFWWPGRLDGKKVAAATDHLDLHETLRDLAGAPPSPAAGALGRGESLAPYLFGAPPPGDDDVQLAAAGSLAGGIFAARWGNRKLIWAPRRDGAWGQGQRLGRNRQPEAVFDLETDPDELNNLAGEPSLATDWLRSRLRAWVDRELLAERGAPAEELTVDEATRAQLRALGYVD